MNKSNTKNMNKNTNKVILIIHVLFLFLLILIGLNNNWLSALFCKYLCFGDMGIAIALFDITIISIIGLYFEKYPKNIILTLLILSLLSYVYLPIYQDYFLPSREQALIYLLPIFFIYLFFNKFIKKYKMKIR